MRALVLSGGSIKGAYEAGAVLSIVEAGFCPDAVLGISTGALSAAFLVNAIGLKTDQRPSTLQWVEAASEFVDFYHNRLSSPELVVRQKSWLTIAWDLLWSRFDGVLDTTPLHRLIRETLKEGALRRAQVQLRVGAVDMGSGQIAYVGADHQDIVAFVKASCAEPLVMPSVRIGGADYYDGGIRDLVPVGTAINLGATEIVAVVCQPRTLDRQVFPKGHVVAMANRLVEVVTNEIVVNDLRSVERVNQVVRAVDSQRMFGREYAPIEWRLVEPPSEIKVDIRSFTQADIERMIEQGREMGRRAMEGPWHTGAA
ncbi:MAG TPA: patatin-like phospholipase family protein, partial [Gemmatimonadales bacterium]|nr:patatin-like phospholipase family protein [Gemmatimonadales bacterium]